MIQVHNWEINTLSKSKTIRNHILKLVKRKKNKTKHKAGVGALIKVYQKLEIIGTG